MSIRKERKIGIQKKKKEKSPATSFFLKRHSTPLGRTEKESIIKKGEIGKRLDEGEEAPA